MPSVIASDNDPQFRSKVVKTWVSLMPSNAGRLKRNLRLALIAFHADSQDRWNQDLEWLKMEFNDVCHEGSKTSPFKHIKRACENLKLSRGKSKRKYDKYHTQNPFKVGDFVLCQAHTLWKDPLKIQRFLAPVMVALCYPVNGKFVGRAHISQSKKSSPNLK
ncbi:hypothetical protein PR048_011371 [Dryococelus australis]|uniref:Integrase catalytic domain-containing protein n=1 Tax=Dryococelus australis TaxID=614101 RepID=A0ABQ9HLX1_9NEOP|nr:hypothetical protein PR048_011371 [Dryococelus australis]